MPKRKRDEFEEYLYEIHEQYINEILAKETSKIIKSSLNFADWKPDIELLKIGYNDIKVKYEELKNFQIEDQNFDEVLSTYEENIENVKYASFNRCNEIMKRFLQKYDLNVHHGLSSYARVSDELDIEWRGKNKIKICEKNTIFHKILRRRSLSGYNYPFLFRRLIQTIMNDDNPKPAILRLGSECHIFVGLLIWKPESGKINPKFDLELFDAGGEHKVLTDIKKFLKKCLKPTDVNIFQVVRLDLQSLTFDNLCQTWIYYYLKKRLVDSKTHFQIFNEIRHNLLFEGNIVTELLLFLSELYYNESLCSYYIKMMKKHYKNFSKKFLV